jgi:hypothetical protein
METHCTLFKTVNYKLSLKFLFIENYLYFLPLDFQLMQYNYSEVELGMQRVSFSIWSTL